MRTGSREFQQRRNAALLEQLTAIPNIHDAVHRIHAHHDARIACASGADRFKVEMQLRKVGLMDYFEGRIFSGYETPRSKPFPDVYLAAAEALRCRPAALRRGGGHGHRCHCRRGGGRRRVRLCARRATARPCAMPAPSRCFPSMADLPLLMH